MGLTVGVRSRKCPRYVGTGEHLLYALSVQSRHICIRSDSGVEGNKFGWKGHVRESNTHIP